MMPRVVSVVFAITVYVRALQERWADTGDWPDRQTDRWVNTSYLGSCGETQTIWWLDGFFRWLSTDRRHHRHGPTHTQRSCSIQLVRSFVRSLVREGRRRTHNTTGYLYVSLAPAAAVKCYEGDALGVSEWELDLTCHVSVSVSVSDVKI
ncbi:hypothetical protein BZA05DRAFT_201328 [Tricharina praecox]|uniref:uncharacterized protein n=1 Tax=Tricharina praecox TaxID=43433 RepID=UPI0022204B00|nr:uncharacterized protein BZA05DRAFT_201328 [Tricharina praecox]KAI5856455.1 hypothetical protein BZA05DRAFT_201328 [Tricharina praecox]